MKELGRIILELIIVAAVAIVLGLIVNRVRSDGLTLARDFFARPKMPATRPVVEPPHIADGGHSNPATRDAGSTATGPSDSDSTTLTGTTDPEVVPDNGASGGASDAVAERLAGMGLQLIGHDEVAAAFAGDQYMVGGIAIIDARDLEKYEAGHIPYALRLDHYRLDTLEEVLPVAMGAQRVIVYCNGGDCEDSEFVAIDLLNNGVDPSKLFVYIGGIVEWREQGMPVQTGDRFSQQISEGGK